MTTQTCVTGNNCILHKALCSTELRRCCCCCTTVITKLWLYSSSIELRSSQCCYTVVIMELVQCRCSTELGDVAVAQLWSQSCDSTAALLSFGTVVDFEQLWSQLQHYNWSKEMQNCHCFGTAVNVELWLYSCSTNLKTCPYCATAVNMELVLHKALDLSLLLHSCGRSAVAPSLLHTAPALSLYSSTVPQRSSRITYHVCMMMVFVSNRNEMAVLM